MSPTKPIPVRLSNDVIVRLDASAKKIGQKRAGVIRLLIESWLVYFEKNGEAALPLNFREIIAAFDNRKLVNSDSKSGSKKFLQAAAAAIEEDGLKVRKKA